MILLLVFIASIAIMAFFPLMWGFAKFCAKYKEGGYAEQIKKDGLGPQEIRIIDTIVGVATSRWTLIVLIALLIITPYFL